MEPFNIALVMSDESVVKAEIVAETLDEAIEYAWEKYSDEFTYLTHTRELDPDEDFVEYADVSRR